jgi:hypothetical protein
MSEDYPKHDRDCANKVDRALLFAKQQGVDFEKVILPIFKDTFCCNYRPHKKLVKQMCDGIWEQTKEHMKGGEKD